MSNCDEVLNTVRKQMQAEEEVKLNRLAGEVEALIGVRPEIHVEDRCVYLCGVEFYECVNHIRCTVLTEPEENAQFVQVPVTKNLCKKNFIRMVEVDVPNYWRRFEHSETYRNCMGEEDARRKRTWLRRIMGK